MVEINPYKKVRRKIRNIGNIGGLKAVGVAGNQVDEYRFKINKPDPGLNYAHRNLRADLTNVVTPEGEGAMVYYKKDKPKDASFFNDLKDKAGNPIENTLKLPENTQPKPTPADPLNPTTAEQAEMDKWDAAENAKKVRDALNPVFNETPAFQNAMNEYTKLMMGFAEKVKPLRRNADTLYWMLAEIVQDGRKAIIAQHAAERAELEKKFTDPAFQYEIAQLFKLTLPPSAADIDQIKDDMLKKMDATHSTQISEFEKNTNTIKDNLTKEIAKQNSKTDTIRQIARLDRRNYKHILKMAEKKRKERDASLPPPPMVMMSIGDDKQLDISGLDISDLSTIFTPTGSKIKIENGVVTCKFPWGMFHPWKYGPQKDAVLSDFTLLATTIRELGHQSITMTMNFNTPEKCLQRAKQAYQACIEAGFPPDKIKVKGKNEKGEIIEYSKDQLEPPDKKQALAMLAEQRKKELEERTAAKPIGSVDSNKIKSGMAQLRAASTASAADIAARQSELLAAKK